MCGVADMKLLDFNVRLNVYMLNLRRLLSIVIRCASLFGVGGSGRSPINPPTPRDEGGGVGVNKKPRVRSYELEKKMVKTIL